ncbi:MAG: hypothetical protein J3Q66DRAFT_355220 [Benniella sp.]|nr:MAG: hypothetical protein J3Q66DRAFT_355220 [Benniella sp.]
MLALTDKVFLPITVFVLNVVLAVLKFILISAVGACFAIYAKYGGEYAKSVGWIRSAGYLEMVHTFRSTSRRKDVPGLVKWALVVAFFVTLAASFLDKGIAIFVTPATRPGEHTTTLVTSSQYRFKGASNIFVGWEFAVQGNDSAKDTMMKALNSSIANPHAVDGQTYTPVFNAFNATCTDLSVRFGAYSVTNNGCMEVMINFLSFRPSRLLKMSQRSPNQWSITIESNLLPREYNFLDVPVVMSISIESGVACVLTEDYRYRNPMDWDTTGITAFPKTFMSNCILNSSTMIVAAMTTTRIGSVWTDTKFGGAFADESDELLLGMYEALKSADVTLKNGTSTVWTELRVTNSTINLYACATSRADRDVPSKYECVYSSIDTFILTKEPDYDLWYSLPPNGYIAGPAFMSIDYAMRTRTTGKVSNDQMKQDTMAVADYMAQLGYNFYRAPGTFSIHYNVIKPRPGFEIPLWVLIIAGIILIINLTLWQLTYWLVGSPHNSSVYSVIRDRLASRSNTPIPRLMRFQYEPLMFEDVKLLPDRVDSMSNEYRFLLGGVTVDTSPKTE